MILRIFYDHFLTAPAVFIVDAQGLVGCLDPVIFDWLSYLPTNNFPAKKRGNSPFSGVVDQGIADSTSPLKYMQTDGKLLNKIEIFDED